MSKSLKIHHGSQQSCDVSVNWEIDQSFLSISFEVKDYLGHTHNRFTTDYKDNWGLWEYDVVEAFLRWKGETRYLEIQSSPLSQPFALMIEKPRQKYFIPNHLNFLVHNCVHQQSWKSYMQIELDSIPGESDQLEGNLSCCLGHKENRQYYALNINQEESVDFHRPDLFSLLGEKK